MGSSARARQRIGIDPLRVRYLSDGNESVGEILEVSRTGMFVRTQEFPRPGAVVALQFHDPNGGALVDARGEVRWNTQGLAHVGEESGFGVLVFEAPQAYRDFFAWAQSRVEKDECEDL